MVLRALVFVHRWLGVALCLLFLLWFPSGIGMMYWTFPSVSAADRLAHAPALDPSTINLSPIEAARRIDAKVEPSQIRLNSVDGRPVYRINTGAGEPRLIYADTGEARTTVTEWMRDRAAAAWVGQPIDRARREAVTSVDQWTVASGLRSIRPLDKYSWPNGDQVYVAGATGEVVQSTTTYSRVTAHLSAIPHWIYYTPLRSRQPIWLQFMIWTSGIGAIGALIGMVVGAWMYSPTKAYRLRGTPTGVPYRGQKRWHTTIGLVFGTGAITWAFSGMMSLDPFPAAPRQARGLPGGASVATALRGRVSLSDFSGVDVRAVLAAAAPRGARELEFTSFAGTPLVAVGCGDGRTQMVALDGTRIGSFEREQILDPVRKASLNPSSVDVTLLDHYDIYYLDRTRQAPLPVWRVLMNDAEHTRYYIDPATAKVLTTYSDRAWVSRWLYHGLHSLNFPWLYNYRPLWDVVVIACMLGGTALSVTSLILAWRALGRALRRGRRPAAELAAGLETDLLD